MRSFGIHGSAQLWRAEGYKRSPSVAGPVEGLEGEPSILAVLCWIPVALALFTLIAAALP